MADQRCWWEWARAFQRLAPEERKRVSHSKSARCHLARIAALHPTLGRALDEERAPLRVHAFVAYAPDLLDLPRSVGQHRRHAAVMKFWGERGRWPLAHEIHILGVTTGTAAPPAAPPGTAGAEATAAQEPPPVQGELLVSVLALACEQQQDPELAAYIRAFARPRREGAESDAAATPACGPRPG
jgi:hypothetical protein